MEENVNPSYSREAPLHEETNDNDHEADNNKHLWTTRAAAAENSVDILDLVTITDAERFHLISRHFADPLVFEPKHLPTPLSTPGSFFEQWFQADPANAEAFSSPASQQAGQARTARATLDIYSPLNWDTPTPVGRVPISSFGEHRHQSPPSLPLVPSAPVQQTHPVQRLWAPSPPSLDTRQDTPIPTVSSVFGGVGQVSQSTFTSPQLPKVKEEPEEEPNDFQVYESHLPLDELQVPVSQPPKPSILAHRPKEPTPQLPTPGVSTTLNKGSLVETGTTRGNRLRNLVLAKIPKPYKCPLPRCGVNHEYAKISHFRRHLYTHFEFATLKVTRLTHLLLMDDSVGVCECGLYLTGLDWLAHIFSGCSVYTPVMVKSEAKLPSST